MRKSTLDLHHDDSFQESLFEKIEKYFFGILLAIALIGGFFFILLR